MQGAVSPFTSVVLNNPHVSFHSVSLSLRIKNFMREASALEYAFAQTVVGAEQRRGAVGAGGGKEGGMIMDQKDMHYVDC